MMAPLAVTVDVAVLFRLNSTPLSTEVGALAQLVLLHAAPGVGAVPPVVVATAA